MDLHLDTVVGQGKWAVQLAVRLDRRETNELFMLGDRLISWPTDGLDEVSFGQGGGGDTSDTPFLRYGMFLSEVVAHSEGISLVYSQEVVARQAAAVLEYQVRHVFE